jgi:hypothetical protein
MVSERYKQNLHYQYLDECLSPRVLTTSRNSASRLRQLSCFPNPTKSIRNLVSALFDFFFFLQAGLKTTTQRLHITSLHHPTYLHNHYIINPYIHSSDTHTSSGMPTHKQLNISKNQANKQRRNGWPVPTPSSPLLEPIRVLIDRELRPIPSPRYPTSFDPYRPGLVDNDDKKDNKALQHNEDEDDASSSTPQILPSYAKVLSSAELDYYENIMCYDKHLTSRKKRKTKRSSGGKKP